MSSTDTATRAGDRVAAVDDDVPVAVLRFDRDGVVAVNRRWVALTGLEPVASTGSGWLSAVHSDDWMTARQFVQTAQGGQTTAEWRVLGADGRDATWVQATSGGVGTGQDVAFVVALTEIDAHKANEAGLLHRALHDPLTGLLNQSAFMSRVNDAVERAQAEFGLCAVLYLDLDHFKFVNDEFGHKCGDHLLAAVSRRIRASLRPSDTLARLGGDEIGVLCAALESEGEAIQLAERIVSTIGQPFTIDERVLHTSVSVGVAFSNGNGLAPTELVEQADRAMYRAKLAGRAQWSTMTDTGTSAPIEPSDVKDVLVRVLQAQGQLHDLLGRLNLQDPVWNRLTEASRALTRATHLLEGQSRIG
jgi:diguanylate cyclase (GGDEF)-like protein/PAS domain S-box-containing protein